MTLLKSCLSKYSVLVRKFSSDLLPVQEVSIPVPWGEIRGKWWGPTDSRPILSLHGWQVSLVKSILFNVNWNNNYCRIIVEPLIA